MVKISATIAITSIMIDQIFFPRRWARVRLHIYRRTILQWSLHHALQALKLGYEILFLAFFGLAVSVTLAVVAPLALPGRKTLFLAIDLPSLAVNREVHDKLRAAVAPAQGQQLVAENAPLKHVREYLANTLHPQSGLRQVGIIHNKHCRKMALLIVFPYGHGLDEMTGDVPDDVASLYCPWP